MQFFILISYLGQIVKSLKKSPVYDPFTRKSYLFAIVSIGLNLSDYGSDIAVAILLRREHDTDWWFSLTVALIILPLFLVNIFSIFWFHQVRLGNQNVLRGSPLRDFDLERLEIIVIRDEISRFVRGKCARFQDHKRQRSATTFREGGFCPVKKKLSSKERFAVVLFHCFFIGPVLR